MIIACFRLCEIYEKRSTYVKAKNLDFTSILFEVNLLDSFNHSDIIILFNYIHGVVLFASDPIDGWTVTEPSFEVSTEMANSLM
jgi:hypothetical protein